MLPSPPKVTVRSIQKGDVEFVAANMRKHDADEVWAGALNTPLQSLVKGVARSSKVWVLDYDGTPVAIFGVAPRGLFSNVGVPWLLGTNMIKKHTRAFLELSLVYVPQMAEGFVRLENYVDSRNKLSIRWLKWIGFEFSELVPTLVHGVMFQRFSKE